MPTRCRCRARLSTAPAPQSPKPKKDRAAFRPRGGVIAVRLGVAHLVANSAPRGPFVVFRRSAFRGCTASPVEDFFDFDFGHAGLSRPRPVNCQASPSDAAESLQEQRSLKDLLVEKTRGWKLRPQTSALPRRPRITASSPACPIASSIHSPIWRISASPIPREVTAGVQSHAARTEGLARIVGNSVVVADDTRRSSAFAPFLPITSLLVRSTRQMVIRTAGDQAKAARDQFVGQRFRVATTFVRRS